MIAGCENRIQSDRTVEIPLGSSKVSEVVFGYAAEEIIPVICRIELGEHIEVLNGESITAVGESLSSAHKEDVLVVLGIDLHNSCRQEKEDDHDKFQNFMHNSNKFPLIAQIFLFLASQT